MAGGGVGAEIPGFKLTKAATGHDNVSGSPTLPALYPSSSNGRPPSQNFEVTLDLPQDPISGIR